MLALAAELAPPRNAAPARPRTLIVSHLAYPHVGGVEGLVDLEIRALTDAGHEVTLLTSDGTGAGQASSPARILRVPAWHVLERRFGVPYPLFLSPRLLWNLWRELGRTDQLHAHGFLFQNAVLAVALAKLRGVPSILTDHGGIQKFGSPVATKLARLAAETVGRVSCRLADRVVTYNARIQTDLARLGRRRDVVFLPNPVDDALFRPPTPAERAAARRELGWPPHRKVVLFVGRLIAAKGVPLLLAAADPAAFDIVFCGPGDPPPPAPGVQYLPPRPQRELVLLYHAADCLALPAEVREGFPLVVQEAVACGLPVVLGYDPGFEPYRNLPNLFFTDRTPANLKAALRAALAVTDRRAGADFFPPLAAWVRRLYAPEGSP